MFFDEACFMPIGRVFTASMREFKTVVNLINLRKVIVEFETWGQEDSRVLQIRRRQ